VRVIALDLGHPRRDPLADEGMDDRVEPGQPVGVAEDDPAQSLAVERAVRAYDVRPELGNDRVEARRTGFDDVAGDPVGVDDDSAEVGEAARDLALARADPPGQPDGQHVNCAQDALERAVGAMGHSASGAAVSSGPASGSALVSASLLWASLLWASALVSAGASSSPPVSLRRSSASASSLARVPAEGCSGVA